MEQFNNWEDFWKKWHNVAVKTEADLYYQVAKTINKEPIKKEIFDLINKSIAEILKLDKNETLIELCCGNGLCTYEFGKICKQVIAVDYSPHLIETAKQHKGAPNITYHRANVLDFLKELKKDTSIEPTKYLMNDSLAYFEPKDLEEILQLMIEISGKGLVFLIRGVPNDEIKWNYYNTPERRQFYEDLQAKGDFTNAGMGKWWQPAEIQGVCDRLKLNYKIQNQVPPISNYRMDILITGK